MPPSRKSTTRTYSLFSKDAMKALQEALSFAPSPFPPPCDNVSSCEGIHNSERTLSSSGRGMTIGIRGDYKSNSSDEDENKESDDSQDDAEEKEPKSHGENITVFSTAQKVETQTPSILIPIPPNTSSDVPAISSTSDEGSLPAAAPAPLRRAIVAPTAILAPGRRTWNIASVCNEYLSLSESIVSHPNNKNSKPKVIIILLLRSGRFAGGVFTSNSTNANSIKCLVHRSCTRYTVRKGQGGSQSANDSNKGKAKSIGAQLRRDGEKKLRADVSETLKNWKSHVNNAALIFVSCPKTMQKGFYEDCSVGGVLDKGDKRIRGVPLSIGRPSFDEVCHVHQLLMEIMVRDMTAEELASMESAEVVTNEDEEEKKTVAVAGQVYYPKLRKPPMSSTNTAIANENSSDTTSKDDKSTLHLPPQEEDRNTKSSNDDIIPLTPVHEAVATGDLSELQSILESSPNSYDINAPAGPKEMTPLHFAAAYSTTDASKSASCITALLTQYSANPCMVDSHNRVPYFLASNDKAREAFRMARHDLGEDYCLWDEGAKVGPPLSNEMLQKKKQAAADKKRRQRARQKEKKAANKIAEEEAAKHEKLEQEKAKKEEDAKRIRHGLKPKTTSSKGASDNICDYCQTVCKGKKKSQMFARLDYRYCSTDCVRNHQRELAAMAAMARMGAS